MTLIKVMRASHLHCTTLDSSIRPWLIKFHILQQNQQKINQNQCRYYRKFHRVPVKVIPVEADRLKMRMEDYVEQTKVTVNEEVLQEMEALKSIKKKNSNTSFESITEKIKLYGMEKNHNSGKKQESFTDVIEEDSFENKSDSQNENSIKNPLQKLNVKLLHKAPGIFRNLLKQCRVAKSRKDNNILMLDTPTLIQEALAAGLQPSAIYFSRLQQLTKIVPKNIDSEEFLERMSTYNIFRTPYKDISLCSSLTASPGILGVFSLTDAEEAYLNMQQMKQNQQDMKVPCSIILDSVKEPGNLGAILRTAAAAGVMRVILTKGCCNPWESKALRAASGAHFSLEIIPSIEWHTIYNYTSDHPSVYLADICNGDREPLPSQTNRLSDLEEEDVERDTIELERTLRQRAEFMKSGARESRMKPAELGNKAEILVCEDEEGTTRIDDSFNDENLLDEYMHVTLPGETYSNIKFFPNTCLPDSDREIIVIFGSEAGLSNCSKKFAADNYGTQISIPLHNNVESLNTSVATGVIMFEVLNQYTRALNPIQRETDEVSESSM